MDQSNNESEEYTIMQYFHRKVSDIPQSFVTQFVTNYLHRDTWVRSDYLFEWFIVISPKYRYDDYTRKLKKIVKETEMKEYSEKSSDQNSGTASKRKIYLISQKGMKTFMMTVSDETREYYATLEEHLFNYIDYQKSCQERQIQLKDAQILSLKHKNPESIYQIYDKRTCKLLYIGSDLSALQNRRYQHLTQRLNIIMAKHQLIDTFLATMDIQDIEIKSISCEPGTARQKETQLIKELQPEFNIRDSVNNKYICLCNPAIEYSNRVSYEKHMELKHPYVLQQQEENYDYTFDNDN